MLIIHLQPEVRKKNEFFLYSLTSVARDVIKTRACQILKDIPYYNTLVKILEAQHPLKLKLKSLAEHETSLFIIVINFNTETIMLGLQLMKATIKINGVCQEGFMSPIMNPVFIASTLQPVNKSIPSEHHSTSGTH